MNLKFFFLFSSILLFTISCRNSNIDKFSYEIINDEKHIELTKMNLVNLYLLDDDEIHDLLMDLNYELQREGKRKNVYIQKTDTTITDFQLFSLVKSKEKGVKGIDITWTNMEKKDRFAKLIADFERDGDRKTKDGNGFIFKSKGKIFMAEIEDIGVGKSINYFDATPPDFF